MKSGSPGNCKKNLLPDIPARVGEFEFAHEYQAALEEAQVGGEFSWTTSRWTATGSDSW